MERGMESEGYYYARLEPADPFPRLEAMVRGEAVVTYMEWDT